MNQIKFLSFLLILALISITSFTANGQQERQPKIERSGHTERDKDGNIIRSDSMIIIHSDDGTGSSSFNFSFGMPNGIDSLGSPFEDGAISKNFQHHFPDMNWFFGNDSTGTHDPFQGNDPFKGFQMPGFDMDIQKMMQQQQQAMKDMMDRMKQPGFNVPAPNEGTEQKPAKRRATISL